MFKSGGSIPAIGLGTWNLTGEACEQTVREALRLGYRHIDTADAYGNHAEVAGGIAASGIEREELFLTTKVWRTDLAHDPLIGSAERFLNELNTSYIDLLLIHWPNRSIPIDATLRAMEELKRAGKVRAVGVSNFTVHHLEDALATGIEIAADQVEMRPLFNQQALREFCAARQMIVTAYSPLGQGRDLRLPVIEEMAKKYGKTPAQIALNWIVSRGAVAIPKTAHLERLKENLESTEFVIEESDLARIDAVPQESRMNNPSFAEFEY
jgi:diketogulonate reductase-like aldo/keto reductase